jgi:hypothetical protein
MGSGKSYSHKETDFTRNRGRDEAFEIIIEKLVRAGAEIFKDETTPMYMDLGNSEIETGFRREVLFNLAKHDYKMIREVQTVRVNKSGRLHSTEELENPMQRLKLYKKPELSEDYIAVDMDALF